MNNVIPAPSRYRELSGCFEINKDTQIFYMGRSLTLKKVAAKYAAMVSEISGQPIECIAIQKSITPKSGIILNLCDELTKLGNEGYRLSVSRRCISINASKPAGLFYALQTLRQLLAVSLVPSGQSVKIPCVRIEDVPRFQWRGMHYDPCRRFFGLSHVLQYIDWLALLKFNVLHLHLTDDQGWRIEIKKYPKLTEIGAWRNGTRNHYWKSKGDKRRYGGFFSQEDIKKIVQYAKERFITVLPEIEMPGHAQAAIAAYPELSCTGGPHKVWTQWGISKDVYCAGNEKVFAFLENILKEVMELFPSRYIHVGGDECPKDRWQKCPKCQHRMKKNGLASEAELQSYFIRRMEKFLKGHGRKLIGWEEILEGRISKTASIMSWRSYDAGIKASAAGHKVVMTPNAYTYLDHRPSDDTRSGQTWVMAFERVYSFDPERGVSHQFKKNILGGQGAMWTEYMNNPAEFYHHLFPRVCALSEVLWSPKRKPAFPEFEIRSNNFMKLMVNKN